VAESIKKGFFSGAGTLREGVKGIILRGGFVAEEGNVPISKRRGRGGGIRGSVQGDRAAQKKKRANSEGKGRGRIRILVTSAERKKKLEKGGGQTFFVGRKSKVRKAPRKETVCRRRAKRETSKKKVVRGEEIKVTEP